MLRLERLDALVKELEIEISSSQEEFELWFVGFHGFMLAQVGRGFALRSFQFGVEEEVATELSDPSSVMVPWELHQGDMDFRLLFFCSLVGWEFKEVLSVSDDVCVEGDLNYKGGTIEYAHCIFPLRSWAIIIRRKGPRRVRVRVRIVGLWDSLKSKLHEDGPFHKVMTSCRGWCKQGIFNLGRWNFVPHYGWSETE